MLPGKVFTPKDVIAIVARRKWLLLLPFRLLGITVNGLFALLRAIVMLPARVLGGTR